MSPSVPESTADRRRRRVWFALLLAVYIGGWLSATARIWGASFRFTVPLVNYLFVIALQAIPFALFVIARQAWSGWRLVLARAVSIPLILIALPIGCTASACVALGTVTFTHDWSFERIHTFDAPHGRLAVYRSNGGAMTAFGIHVDQECAVVPGLLVLSHPLVIEYPAYDADAQFPSDVAVRLAVHGAERKGLPATLHFDVPLCPHACLCSIPDPDPIERASEVK